MIDTQKMHFLSLNKALNDFGYFLTEEEENTDYKGLPTRQKLKLLSFKKNIPVSLHDRISVAKKNYFMEVRDSIQPQVDLLPMFNELKDRGFKIAICSNSIRDSVDYFIQKLRLAPYVDLSLSNEDVSLPKPNPEIYIKAQQHFNFLPTECLIVEDSVYGVKAAIESQSFVMQVSGVHQVTLQAILSYIKSLEHES